MEELESSYDFDSVDSPKLLETIPEESVLSLKDAVIDEDDPLCI